MGDDILFFSKREKIQRTHVTLLAINICLIYSPLSSKGRGDEDMAVEEMIDMHIL